MKRCHLELVLLLFVTCAARAQVALLREEPFGLFGTINPTGHIGLGSRRTIGTDHIHSIGRHLYVITRNP